MEKVRSKTFSNGFTLVYAPHKVRSVTCCLRGLAGSNYETPEQIGAAHLLEHMHLLSSINYKKTKDLHSLVKQNGGRVTGTTSRDDVAFLTKSLKEYYTDGLDLLEEAFKNPSLDKRTMEIAKSVVSHEIKQNVENPVRHIGRIAYKILFPKQRFESFNTGNIEEVKKLKLKDVKNFREQFYVPGNFVLSICGDLNWNELVEQVENRFASIKYAKAVERLEHQPGTNLGVQVENRKDSVQLHLKTDYHGYKADEIEKYASVMLSNLLREELSAMLSKGPDVRPYLLDVASFASNTYGLFGLYTSINDPDLLNFFSAFKKAARKLVTRRITEERLNLLKNKIRADFEFTLEKTSLRADYYSELYLYENLAKTHEEELEYFEKVTTEDIKSLARNLFMQNPKITVITKKLKADDVLKTWKKA